jgi:hypothetical protein
MFLALVLGGWADIKNDMGILEKQSLALAGNKTLFRSYPVYSIIAVLTELPLFPMTKMFLKVVACVLINVQVIMNQERQL